MSPQSPFDNPKLLIELAQAFESIWLVMRAHERESAVPIRVT
jgi:hypothetical protein